MRPYGLADPLASRLAVRQRSCCWEPAPAMWSSACQCASGSCRRRFRRSVAVRQGSDAASWLKSAPPVIRWSGVRSSTRGSFLQHGRAADSSCKEHWRVCWAGELSRDSLVALGDLSLMELKSLKVLAQHEQVFGAIVVGQRRGNLWFAGLAALRQSGSSPSFVSLCRRLTLPNFRWSFRGACQR